MDIRRRQTPIGGRYCPIVHENWKWSLERVRKKSTQKEKKLQKKNSNGWNNSQNTRKIIMGRQLHFHISSAAAARLTQISFLYYCKKFQHKFSCRLRPGKSKLKKIAIANNQFSKRPHYFKMTLREYLYARSLAKFKGFL